MAGMTDATPHAETDDPYLWLEDVSGEEALTWVRERNDETLASLATGQRFEDLKAGIRAVLDSDERIPYVHRRGDRLYNFWQDATHPRGLWRRTTLDSYRTADPDWEILLDVDALGAEESENWVWQGAAVLRPDFRRCLVQLSRGGADASVVREFDLEEKAFVEDGFVLPEAKTNVGWIDLDTIYVGTDFGPGSLTNSGYPRVAKVWRRGTPLSEAVTVYEGKPDDVRDLRLPRPGEGVRTRLRTPPDRLLHQRDLPPRSGGLGRTGHQHQHDAGGRRGPRQNRRTRRRRDQRAPRLAPRRHAHAVDGQVR